ncbi:MAG: DUF2147 domain-containing protein [Alphaproteobacteria bacterium]|nr:DUF2147 domain-containing protein [Alphaproteobacteria bacterium]
MKNTGLFGLFLLVAVVIGWQPAFAQSSPEGIWIDNKGRGGVEIKSCGGRKLCGRIVWVKNRREQHGCGQMLIGNVRPRGGGEWDFGWIIDPDDRKKYDVALKRISRTRLKVTGYMGSRFLSQDFIWTLAPKNIVRCDAKPKKKTVVAAAPKVPVARGPKSAPTPSRKPHVYGLSVAELQITPPSPVLAVRPSRSVNPLAQAEAARRSELSEDAKAAFDVLNVAADPVNGSSRLISGPRRVASRMKTCLIRAPFATVPFACRR